MNITKKFIINFCVNLVALILVKITLLFLNKDVIPSYKISIMLIIGLALLATIILDRDKKKETY